MSDQGTAFDSGDHGPGSGKARGTGPTMASDGTTERARLDQPDRVDALVDFLAPTVRDLLSRLDGEEFTTVQFIDLLLTVPSAAGSYRETLNRWGEGERRAKMVVHGQVIPAAMRRSGLVEWIGFAHGVDDPYAVPARWRLLPRPREDAEADRTAPTS